MADPEHGTPSAYNKKCRCEVCVQGKRDRDRAYYLKNQERIKARTIAYYAENREAARERNAEYREANAEAIKAQKRAAYAADPEPAKQRRREWDAANPERRKALSAAYRKANPEKIRKRKLADYHKAMATDPEKVRARRRAAAKTPQGALYSRLAAHKRRGAKPDAEAREWAAIILRDPCAYCGEAAIEIDHIEPLARGGAGTWDNLTGACRGCNARKNDQPLLSFVAA